jgi:surface polysaccharide O-acyltransferase-like enzyme
MQQKSWDIFLPWIWHQVAFGASFHFWYLYMILGLYLFLPWIHAAIIQMKKLDIEVFLGIWGLTLLGNWPRVALYFPHVEFMYFSGYLGYLVMGQYLMRYKVRGAVWWYLVGCGLTIVGTYYLSKAKGSFDIRMYGNLSLPVALMAVGIFGIFQKVTFVHLRFNRFVGLISQLSFGIYFIHVMVLYYLSRAQINYAYHGLEVGIPLTTIACLTISSVLIFLIKKLPSADRIIG